MSIVNESEVEWEEDQHGENYIKRKKLGRDGERIGCSLYELPTQKRSWPYHYHTGNEEAIYVLDGEGKIRLGEEKNDIERGDYVVLPEGDEGSHQMINDSDGTLRYLVISTMDEPDVTIYPDSDKFGIFVGSPPGSDDERDMQGFYRCEDDVDFWQGE